MHMASPAVERRPADAAVWQSVAVESLPRREVAARCASCIVWRLQYGRSWMCLAGSGTHCNDQRHHAVLARRNSKPPRRGLYRSRTRLNGRSRASLSLVPAARSPGATSIRSAARPRRTRTCRASSLRVPARTRATARRSSALPAAHASACTPSPAALRPTLLAVLFVVAPHPSLFPSLLSPFVVRCSFLLLFLIVVRSFLAPTRPCRPPRTALPILSPSSGPYRRAATGSFGFTRRDLSMDRSPTPLRPLHSGRTCPPPHPPAGGAAVLPPHFPPAFLGTSLGALARFPVLPTTLAHHLWRWDSTLRSLCCPCAFCVVPPLPVPLIQ